MLMVNLAGILLIALIVWWFWLYKPKEVELKSEQQVIVVNNGTYTPSRIKVKANEPISLQFLRKDASPCAEMVVIPKLDISRSLPVEKTSTLRLPAMEPGEYDFHCQMQMYRGKLIVS